MAYTALLDRILEDRHIDDSEADALVEMAAEWGLSGEQINLANSAYLNQLVIAAVADEVVTDAERRDLKRVARLLGQDKQDLDVLLRKAAEVASVTPGVFALPAARRHAAKFGGEVRGWLSGNARSAVTNRTRAVSPKNVRTVPNRCPL